MENKKPVIDYIRKEYIDKRNMTQENMSKELNIGIKTISELYSNKRDFSIDTAIKFGEYFEIDPYYILKKQLKYNLSKITIKPINRFSSYEEDLRQSKGMIGAINKTKNIKCTIKDIIDLKNTQRITGRRKIILKAMFEEINVTHLISVFRENDYKLKQIKVLHNKYVNECEGLHLQIMSRIELLY